MKKLYSVDILEKFSVPTLSNAVESFDIIPANTGFCDTTMICRFPDMSTIVGYAITSRVSTDQPTNNILNGIDEHAYWRFISKHSGPKIAVCKDIDNPPYGAMWGEYNCNIHKALGCIGLIVEGAIRDIDGIRKLGFYCFSTSILPTHGNGVFIDYGGPVRVAGLEVKTGDLLVCDKHGVISIPQEIPLDKLVAVAAEIDSLENELFDYCQSPHFTINGLEKINDSINKRWPNKKKTK